MTGLTIFKLGVLVAVIGLGWVSWKLFQRARMQHSEFLRQQKSDVDSTRREKQFGQTQLLELSQDKLRSDARFRLLLDSAAEGICGLDLNGCFTFVNKAALRMLSYESEAELLGKNAHQMIRHTRPDGMPYLPSDSMMLRAPTDVRQLRLDSDVLWTNKGSTLPVDIWFYPLYEGKEVCGSVMTFMDITETLRINDEREINEQKYQYLLESSPDAVFVSNVNGKIQYANQTTLNLLGYSKQELLHQSFFKLVPDDHLSAYREQFRDLLARKQPVLVETVLLRKDGTRVALELSATSVFDDGLVYGAFRDISQRHQAENKVRGVAERLAMAMAAAQMGVVEFDVVKQQMVFDRRGCQLHGFPEKDEYRVERSRYLESVYPEDREFVRNNLQRVIDTRSDAQMQFRVMLPGGQRRNMEGFIRPVMDEQGNVTSMLGMCRDITTQKRDEHEANLLAFHDPLTKLPNRRLLMDRLKHALAVSAHARSYGAVLFLDLDHFKTLNDTRGHAMGDLLLLEVASRLQNALREGDSVARLGGDEFVVILETLSRQQETAMQQAELVAGKILTLLARPYELEGYDYQANCSMGISLFIGNSVNVDDLLKHADSAMYRAKAAGRGMYRFFDPAMQKVLEQRAALEDDLRRAVELHDEFKLYCQVQVDAQRRVIGAEILLRWHHPVRGLMLPREFIPLAEENGLIIAIGDWVLKAVVVQLRVWQKHPVLSRLPLSVNVSAKQLRQADFPNKLNRLLKMSDVPAERLRLELTESAMLQNMDDIVVKMDKLKKVGVGLALDGFGTGYSSLSYLKRLPLEQIKIDQSFIRDLTEDNNDAAIVVMIIAMSKVLGFSVLAEGVETQAQQDFLVQHGCHAFQGYLHGRPMLLSQLERVVMAQ